MALMGRYPDKHFDLAIVDPPYGIDVANMNMGLGSGARTSNPKNRVWTKKEWDASAPSPEYFQELFRVSKNQIVWGGNYFDLPPTFGFIVWDKVIPECLSFSHCEFAWTSFYRASRIIKERIYNHKKERIHPTQKPVALYKWLLTNYAKPGDLILDTHVGSASSLIACEEKGFSYVGCELDPEYFSAATKRIETYRSQLKLFTP